MDSSLVEKILTSITVLFILLSALEYFSQFVTRMLRQIFGIKSGKIPSILRNTLVALVLTTLASNISDERFAGYSPGASAPDTQSPHIYMPAKRRYHHHWNRSLASASGAASDTTALLQMEYSKLHFGKFVYNPPDEMVVERREPITVRIYRGIQQPDLRKPLAGHGTVRAEDAKVAPRMAVELSGDNFDVQTKSSRIQFVPDGGFAEWVYHVKPEEEGEQLLILQDSVVLDGDNETELPAIAHQIHVKILAPDLGQRLMTFLDKADFPKLLLGGITTIILGVGGYLLKRWWEQRSSRQS